MLKNQIKLNLKRDILIIELRKFKRGCRVFMGRLANHGLLIL